MLQSGNGGPASKAPTSTYAPRVLSITDNSWVCAHLPTNQQSRSKALADGLTGKSEDPPRLWSDSRSLTASVGWDIDSLAPPGQFPADYVASQRLSLQSLSPSIPWSKPHSL